MNILHYFVGFAFYFGAGLSLIHDAVGFEDAKQRVHISDQWWIWRHIIGTIIFLLGFILQYYTHRGFALLRKTTDGHVVSTAHYMPCGGFFEYVSCPHYFAEILMYLSGCLILGGKSYTWWLLCLWVVTNQILTGLMSHQWYQQKFENYPPKRKAVIPFIV
ncbi:putative polyprenol reductase, partial [Stegodyphus mimosarum]